MLPFAEKHAKDRVLSSKLRKISSSDSSLVEFQKDVKCDRILKSLISDKTVSFVILDLKKFFSIKFQEKFQK